MTPEQAHFEAARVVLRKTTVGSSGDPLSMRRNAEQTYAVTYDKLARLGEVPRLRRKYRF